MINYSIIIPHYNIPDLLMRCLRSIPVREDIQVIVVDDCSPCQEDVFRMLEELNRPYLEFYSTSKGGSAGRARNVGLDHAKGKWLIFADADDFFSKEFNQILDDYRDATEDLLYFNVNGVLSDDITRISNAKCEILNSLFSLKKNKELEFRCHHPVPWGKIVRKSLVDKNSIRFDETRWSNDYFFAVNVGVKANNVAIYDRLLYYITERADSLSQVFCKTHEEMICRAEVAFRVQEVIEKSQYKLYRPILSDDLLRLYFRDKLAFDDYILRVEKLGISIYRIVSHMIEPCGIRDSFFICCYLVRKRLFR